MKREPNDGDHLLDPEATRAVFDLIWHERGFQDRKWGPAPEHTIDRWNTIMNEEVGEVSQAILDGTVEEVVQELVEVAAVAVRIVEAIQAGKVNWRSADIGKENA